MIANDSCTFDFFPNSVKPARNVKKDLKVFLKKRAQYTISNLKLPELDLEGKEEKFQPMKFMEPINNSAALNHDKARDVRERRRTQDKDQTRELDLVLKNIRNALITGSRKLTSVSPELIDQIYKFENLNDFSKNADLDEIVQDQIDSMNKLNQKRKGKRGRSHKPSVYSQFGYESSGLSNLLS